MSNIRVYQYGVLPPIENAAIVREQMMLANRYRNTLIEIERGRRVAIREATRESDQHTQKLEADVASLIKAEEAAAKEVKLQHSETRSRLATKTDKDALKTAREATKAGKKLLDTARKEARLNTDLIDRCDQINDLAVGLGKSARAHCGVYWGTYKLIEDATDASKKMPLPTRRDVGAKSDKMQARAHRRIDGHSRLRVGHRRHVVVQSIRTAEGGVLPGRDRLKRAASAARVAPRRLGPPATVHRRRQVVPPMG